MEDWKGVVPLITIFVLFRYLPSLLHCLRLLIKLYFLSIALITQTKPNWWTAAGPEDVDKERRECWFKKTMRGVPFSSCLCWTKTNYRKYVEKSFISKLIVHVGAFLKKIFTFFQFLEPQNMYTSFVTVARPIPISFLTSLCTLYTVHRWRNVILCV